MAGIAPQRRFLERGVDFLDGCTMGHNLTDFFLCNVKWLQVVVEKSRDLILERIENKVNFMTIVVVNHIFYKVWLVEHHFHEVTKMIF